jgi:hypothetical protein
MASLVTTNEDPNTLSAAAAHPATVIQSASAPFQAELFLGITKIIAFFRNFLLIIDPV